MKVFICILAVFVASSNAGFLFGASGFYGGIGIDSGIETLAEVQSGYDVTGRHRVQGEGAEKIKVVAHEDGDSDRHSGHGGYVGHGSRGGFGGQQEVKPIKVILPEDGSSSLDGNQGGYSDQGGIGRNHAHQEVKIIKIILAIAKDGSENHGGFGTNSAPGGFSGHDGGLSGHQEVKTITVSEGENSVHGDYSSYDGSTGKHNSFDGRSVHGEHNNQVGFSRYSGDPVTQVVQTFKVIQVEDRRRGQIAQGGHAANSGHSGYQEIKTIPVIYGERENAAQGGFGAHGAHGNIFARGHHGGYGGSHGGYGEFSGS